MLSKNNANINFEFELTLAKDTWGFLNQHIGKLLKKIRTNQEIIVQNLSRYSEWPLTE